MSFLWLTHFIRVLFHKNTPFRCVVTVSYSWVTVSKTLQTLILCGSYASYGYGCCLYYYTFTFFIFNLVYVKKIYIRKLNCNRNNRNFAVKSTL